MDRPCPQQPEPTTSLNKASAGAGDVIKEIVSVAKALDRMNQEIVDTRNVLEEVNKAFEPVLMDLEIDPAPPAVPASCEAVATIMSLTEEVNAIKRLLVAMLRAQTIR